MKNMFRKVTLTVAVAAGIFFAPIAYNQVEAAPAVDATVQQQASPAVDTTVQQQAAPAVDATVQQQASPAVDTTVQQQAAPAVDATVQQQAAQPAVNKTVLFQAKAKQYLGVRYTYGGTTTKGFDCSGYVMTVMKQLGISLPRTSKAMYGVGQAVTKANLQPGDLMFFSATPRSKNITHVGIYYGDGKFIHSQTSKGVSFTAVNDKWYWGSRFVGAKRVLN